MPFYSKQEGGFVISAAIQKYMYVIVSKRLHKNILLSYSKSEVCESLNDIQHPVIKECLKFTNLSDHLVILSYADITAQSGLGSSGSFTVGLLHSLLEYSGRYMAKSELAELACHIQMDILKQPSGKQDEYIATFGGISCFEIGKNGSVNVKPLSISDHAKETLQNNLLFFNTGIKRSATEVLSDQKQTVALNPENLEYLRKIKEIGMKIKTCLETDSVDDFGILMDEHWNEKKKTSKKITTTLIDKHYQTAKNLGALGGKVIGAGGGGYMMFYVNDKKSKTNIKKEFLSKGMTEIKFPFEAEGTKIILNLLEGSE